MSFVENCFSKLLVTFSLRKLWKKLKICQNQGLKIASKCDNIWCKFIFSKIRISRGPARGLGDKSRRSNFWTHQTVGPRADLLILSQFCFCRPVPIRVSDELKILNSDSTRTRLASRTRESDWTCSFVHSWASAFTRLLKKWRLLAEHFWLLKTSVRARERFNPSFYREISTA